jgi:hypothetical protein
MDHVDTIVRSDMDEIQKQPQVVKSKPISKVSGMIHTVLYWNPWMMSVLKNMP